MKTLKSKFKVVAVTLLISTISLSTFAKSETDDQEALKRVQEILKDKTKREAVIQKSPDAQAYIQKMNEMGMTSAQQEKSFNIGSDIFTQLLKENNNDAAIVQKILLNAQKDPEAFYNSLSPANKRLIQGLSGEVEANKSSKTPK